MLIPSAYIEFESDLDLEGVANKLSRALFGGIPFDPSRARDESPAVAIRFPVLGLTALLHGGQGPGGYALDIRPSTSFMAPDKVPQPSDMRHVHLDEFIAALLWDVDGIRPRPLRR